jgi:hypothetical protein
VDAQFIETDIAASYWTAQATFHPANPRARSPALRSIISSLPNDSRIPVPCS